MLLQLNPEIKILNSDETSCVMLLKNKKIILHGENYQKYFYSLIRLFRKAINLDDVFADKNYSLNEISEIQSMFDKLLKSNILVFAGYENIKAENDLKILLIDFAQDDLKTPISSLELFSQNNIKLISSDSLALEYEELRDFKEIFKEITSKEYDVVCPIFWYLCPKIVSDITKYAKIVVPIISNSNYFSYGPLTNKKNLNDSLLSLNTEEQRYKYVDFHFARKIDLLPLVFLANEIKQWKVNDSKDLCNCNILHTIYSYNYSSQVFRKKQIVWVKQNGN